MNLCWRVLTLARVYTYVCLYSCAREWASERLRSKNERPSARNSLGFLSPFVCLFSLSPLSLLRNPRCCLPLLLNADTQNCLRARADARANYTEGETLALRQHFKRSSERIVVVVVVVQQSARVELLVSRARGVCTNGQKIRSLRPSLSLSLSGTAAPLWLLLLPDDEVHCCYCYTVLYAKIENGAPHVCVCLSCPYPLSRCPLPRRRSLFCRSTLGFLSRRSRPTHEPLSLSLSRHPVHLFLSAARICIYISLSLSLSLPYLAI